MAQWLRPERSLRPLCAGAGMAVLLAGCSLAPVYHTPQVPVAAAYKTSDDPFWKDAAPADDQLRGTWWTAYGDKTLDDLESRLVKNNPTLAVAVAHYDQAAAYEAEQRSAMAPQVDGSAQPLRTRQSDNKPLRGANQPDTYSARALGLSLNYEVDLWGRVRNEVAAGHARADAAKADLASVTLSLQAQLANLYVQARGDDIQAHILDDSLGEYAKGLAMTQRRLAVGVDSGLSVARAKNQLSDARAQADEVKAQRALLEHAIASLLGESASTFTLPADTSALAVPMTPSSIPSALLQRRPDIAAAERRTFAANADIGVARAAYYPTFSLGGLLGWQDAGGGQLVNAGNRTWAVGPSLVGSLFDGGLRRAQTREARAAFDEASGAYRVTVLKAFQEVEDNLSLVGNLTREAADEDDAAAAAKEAAGMATHRYGEGVVSYLDVVTAQTSYLQAERAAQLVRTRRLQASIDLVRALGGGWSNTGA